MAADFPVRAVLDDKGIDQLIVALTKAGKQANLSEKEIKQMNDQVRKTGTEGVGHINNLNKGMNNMVNDGIKKVGATFLAAFAIDRLVSVGKEIIKITSEFQKFEAVLTNALGSQSAAQIGMKMITDFAAKTPFSVQELTASYVKLVNQGFKPTEQELLKLADLAASTGKGFDQLTEAVIDAQTGEFERLKDFGIRASKEGERVTFTFKGIQTQTDFTNKSIREYILGLGDLQGVTGATAKISETLGGQINNLGDSWDKFLATLGDGQSGPLQTTTKYLATLLALATEFIKTDEQRFDDTKVAAQEKAVETFKAIAAASGDINEAAKDYIKLLDITIAVMLKKSNSMGLDQAKERNALEDRILLMKAEKVAIEDYVKAENNKVAVVEKSTVATKESHKAGRDYIDDVMEPYFEAQRKLNKELDEYNRLLKFSQGLSNMPKNETPFAIDGDGIEMDPEKSIYEGLTKSEWEQKMKDKEQAKREILMAGFDFTVGLIDALREIQNQRNQEELGALEAMRDEELSLAGDNSKAREKINKTFDEKQRLLRIKQSEDAKEQALFDIGINTASAFVKALPNYVLAGIVAASGLLQAGIVSAKKPPRFARGIFDLQGPGTDTSDSITARLSAHETVVPAKGTRKFRDLLKPMVENPNLSYGDVASIIDQNAPSGLRGDIVKVQPQETTNGLLEYKLDKLIKTIEDKRELNFSIDENGFKKWVKEGLSETEFINNRYRSW